MENKLVSVIMPCFNCEAYISETINSVLKQTYSNFEIILVDDCSNDKSIEIAESFEDKRIRIFKNDIKRGAAYSRNKALREAKGEYIAFLDSDDLWSAEKLEKQIHFMETNNASFSYCNYGEFSDSVDQIDTIVTGPKIVNHKKMLRCCYVGCLTVMYRKEICENLQIPDNIFKRNDYALWLVVSQKADCYLLDETLAFYRKRTGSISSGNKFKLIKYHVSLFKKLYKYSTFKSFFYALRNVIFFILKRFKYKKKLK